MYSKFIAAGAFGVGVIVGWAVTADRYDRKLKDVKETNRELLSKSLGRITSVVETNEGIRFEGIFSDGENPPEEDAGGEDVTGEDDENRELTEEEEAALRTNLQKLIDSYTADPDDVETFVDRSKVSEIDRTPPFVISRAKFSWDEEEGDNYDKITVTYYPHDRVVLDDGDEVIDDVNNTLGWRNLSQFGGESEDPDVVFIRNRRMMTDFEVVRDEESPLPLHVKYGMPKEEFEVNKAAGTLRLREEDM